MFTISKYTPQINSMIFRTENKICTALGRKPLKDYKLLEKTEGTDITSFTKDFLCQAPSGASKFNYVKVGKKSDFSFNREVASFFDEKGRVIMRLFRQNGENIKLRKYNYDGIVRTIETKTHDTSRISPEIVDKKFRNFAGRWENKSKEFQLIHKFSDLIKDGKNAILLLTRKIEYSPKNIDRQKVTMTRYPINLGFESKAEKRTAGADVVIKNNDFDIENIFSSPNLRISSGDPFLKYRFIDIRTDDGMKYLTRKFLKDKHLEDMNIYIAPSSNRVSENSIGHFSCAGREICYSPDIVSGTLSRAVDVAAHEVEHAHQHALIGQIGKGTTRYETDAMLKFGFPSIEESCAAVKYSIARDKYPKLSDTEDLSQNEEYMKNLLEVDARKAGSKAVDEFLENYNSGFFSQFYK